MFLVVGVALLAGGAYAYHAIVMRPLSWPKGDAVVASSRVVNPKRPTEYRPEIVFELNDGRGLRRVTIVPSWSSSSYDLVRAYVERYPAGARVAVAINPSNSDDVRYELGPTATSLMLPGVLGGIGLLFSVVGIVVILRPTAAAGPVRSPRTLRWVSGVFMAVGIGVGSFGAWLLTLGTAVDWPEVEATVVDGTVIHVSSTNRSPHRSFYDIQVTFAYEVNGVRVTSKTTSGHSNSSRERTVARLIAYAPGSRHMVRHRPDDPNVVRFEVTPFAERALPVALVLLGVVCLGFGAATISEWPARYWGSVGRGSPGRSGP